MCSKSAMYKNSVLFFACIFLLLIQCSLALDNDDSDTNEKKFVPTNEWQTIPPGQGIPRGLHVRIDMQTGKKEAKLLELDDEFPQKTSAEKDSSALINTVTDDEKEILQKFDHAEMKQALKNIKNDAKDELPKSDDEVASKFRSYEEMKEEMKVLERTIKTEYEIVKDLVANYLILEDDLEKISVLNDLEFYVHQYDNALDFVKMGGFKSIVLPALNSTNNEIRSAAGFLLGSACQSNPKVQIAALEIGSLPYLIRLVTFDSSSEVRNRALYAISGVVRNFPLAQKALVQYGGISAFTTIFLTDSAELVKLQLKIITLLSDIVAERAMAASHVRESVSDTNSTENEMLIEKLNQYDAAGVETVLVEQGFCRLFPRLLTQLPRGDDKKNRREDLSSFRGRPLREEHDLVEKVVQAMLSLSNSCQSEFHSVRSLIQMLKERYSKLSSQENFDQGSQASDESSSELYYTKLYHMCSRLLSDIGKDEL